MSLPELEQNYKKYLDRMTVIYGESGTGKSFILTDVLKHLNSHVGQILIISPTDRQNQTYEKNIAPKPMIHYTITSELLNDIWNRQEAFAAAYKRANDPGTIARLFELTASDATKANIKAIKDQLKLRTSEIKAAELDENKAREKIADMEAECEKVKTLIFKHTVSQNLSKLNKCNLSEKEQYTIKYLNFNPRLVLIFDDCSDQIEKFKKHPVMKKLFFQGRWAYITTISACHSDKVLDAELKKNAFVSIFTAEKSAHAYIDRKTTDMDKEAKVKGFSACKQAFTPLAKHQKLVYIREEDKYYKYTAEKHENFRFGSPQLWEYCDKIKADENNIVLTGNKFAHGLI